MKKLSIFTLMILLFFGCATNTDWDTYKPETKMERLLREEARLREELEVANRDLEQIDKISRNRDLTLGMSKETVEILWGKPKGINSTVNRSGIFEQWVYRFGDSPNALFLYFGPDGKLESVQNSGFWKE